ncbi:uncharacterized protein LOC120633928 isoform X2 [Pararge aegeria]|uniref:uncharacterized protein LOC120633928 isoform X2 n=1 Tax=Pararge aegeria TaxID=116150 RepID=UPI0019D19B24|nr:uncharacterized protein LOC120633928 isoform X2 [Pararge aegeria]
MVVETVHHHLAERKERSADADLRLEESATEKKEAKENQLKRIKSRELRGGIMYYSCHCIKRNGLQHDCRRTGCGGEPSCLVLPDPLCAPSQLARARGLADPEPLAVHFRTQALGSESLADSSNGAGTGQRFIVCELKGIAPDTSTNKRDGGQCCKCVSPVNYHSITDSSAYKGCIRTPIAAPTAETTSTLCNCLCSIKQSKDSISPMLLFDEKTFYTIINKFEDKELAPSDVIVGPRKVKMAEVKEEPCTRLGCVHWKPPPLCVWDAPCKADCFETPPGIQPSRNQFNSSGGSRIPSMPFGENFGKKCVMLTPL